MNKNYKIIVIFIFLIFFLILYFNKKIFFERNYKVNFREIILRNSKINHDIELSKFKNVEPIDSTFLPEDIRFVILPYLVKFAIFKFDYDLQKNGFLVIGKLEGIEDVFDAHLKINNFFDRYINFINGIRNEEYSLLEYTNERYDIKVISKKYNNQINTEIYVYKK